MLEIPINKLRFRCVFAQNALSVSGAYGGRGESRAAVPKRLISFITTDPNCPEPPVRNPMFNCPHEQKRASLSWQLDFTNRC